MLVAVTFEDEVRRVLGATEPGDVMTYGEVAAEAGFPGAARAVGNLLRSSDDLEWWRVVSAAGRLCPGLEADHAQRLRAEGHRVEPNSTGEPRLRPSAPPEISR